MISHGGKRARAGRPRAIVEAERCSFRFRPCTLARIDALANWWGLSRTATIERLVEEDFLRAAVDLVGGPVKRGS